MVGKLLVALMEQLVQMRQLMDEKARWVQDALRVVEESLTLLRSVRNCAVISKAWSRDWGPCRCSAIDGSMRQSRLLKTAHGAPEATGRRWWAQRLAEQVAVVDLNVVRRPRRRTAALLGWKRLT